MEYLEFKEPHPCVAPFLDSTEHIFLSISLFNIIRELRVQVPSITKGVKMILRELKDSIGEDRSFDLGSKDKQDSKLQRILASI